jgi:hypothetical protein
MRLLLADAVTPTPRSITDHAAARWLHASGPAALRSLIFTKRPRKEGLKKLHNSS